MSMNRSSLQEKLWIPLGIFVLLAGITHFANPDFFDAIVPPWLPPSERFWTFTSGLAEIAIGIAVVMPKYRRLGGWAAFALFIAVYPANLYMVWDWRDRSTAEQVVSWVRLPFQFLFLWAAIQVAKNSAVTSLTQRQKSA
jgi:uncharacterized membrane protein